MGQSNGGEQEGDCTIEPGSVEMTGMPCITASTAALLFIVITQKHPLYASGPVQAVTSLSTPFGILYLPV